MQIQAAVCRRYRAPLAIETLELADPGPGQLQVKLAAVAICHSDIAYIDGAWPGQLPAVYGHEAAGWVSAVGAGVEDIAPGAAVMVTLLRACGDCPACAIEDPSSCEQAWAAQSSPLRDARGEPVLQAMNSAAFATAVTVGRGQCHPLPAELPMEQACLLSCGVITGVGAVRNSGALRPGEHCAVIGAGGVGLNAIQGARLCGAATIIAVDLHDDKLTAARDFGATHTLRGDDPAHVDQLRALTGGHGVDAVFVAVGAGAAYQDAPALLAPRGRLVAVGMPPSGTAVSYDPGALAAMNQRLIGSRMGQTHLPRDVPWLLDAWRRGELELAALISGRYRLEHIDAAIDNARSGAARRNVILFD